MTPYELKHRHLEANPNSHFFDRWAMKFFGDTMRNFGVRDGGTVWILYRKHAVKFYLKKSHYFDKKTFEQIVSTEALLGR